MIAIIGTGMTGASAAQMISASGQPFTVFDKSRGIGGRLATRRAGPFSFDHGAAEISGDDPGFRAWLSAYADGAFNETGFRSSQGMSRALAPVFAGRDIRHGVEVKHVARDRTGWICVDASGDRHGPFDAIISTVPAPQAQTICVHALETSPLASVEMSPVWTVLTGGARCVANSPSHGLERVEVGRSAKSGAEAWVYHFDLTTTLDRLESEKPELAQWAWEKLASGRNAPEYLVAHRWRYARTARPLGIAYLGSPEDGVLCGGDWALGDLAQHAWLSGRAMAQAILSR